MYLRYNETSFWDRLSENWKSNYKMIPDSEFLLYKDNFGGGYFISFFVWGWVPAFVSITAVALIPTVPYARRVGVRGAFANVLHKVSKTRGPFRLSTMVLSRSPS